MNNSLYLTRSEYKYRYVRLLVQHYMSKKKSRAKEELDIHSLRFQRIIVTEEQILSNWKAIEDEIESLRAQNTETDRKELRLI